MESVKRADAGWRVMPDALEVHEMSKEEEWQSFDAAARYLLNMSGEEFLTAYKAKHWPDPDAVPGVMEVLSLVPASRR